MLPLLTFAAGLAVGGGLCFLRYRKLRRVLLQTEDHLRRQRDHLARANLDLLERKEDLEKQNDKLDEQRFQLAEASCNILELKETVEQEKERSEKLLLNILPLAVARDLKEFGKTDPHLFENVTVCFVDMVGFTRKCAAIEPDVLITELNEVFTAFDTIIESHRCERIKTIGDAYLALCGMPEPEERHAERMLLAAGEMIAYLEQRNRTHPNRWQVRIGIHSGAVVGAVVGIKKYIYDVFGDTINMASRMETHSEPMKINVSRKAYELLKDRFAFQERPPVEVKGKGMVRMYFYAEETAV
jgi:adenylate cyclase